MKTTMMRTAVAAALMGLAGVALANGTVSQLSGTISVQKPDGSVRLLARNSEVARGDTLNTERDSFAQVKFTDGAVVTLKPNTRFRIEDYAFDQADPARDNSAFALLKGGLRMITGLIGKRGNQDAMRMGTATATIGIRGTTFTVEDCVTSTCTRRGVTRTSAVPGGTDYAAVETGVMTDSAPMTAEEFDRFVATERAAARDPFALLGERVAQSQGDPDANLAPAVYVGVSDGEIIVSNGGGSANFRAGQFGSVPNFNSRPTTLPGDPGLPIYTPPTSFFQAISGGGVRNANAQCIAN